MTAKKAFDDIRTSTTLVARPIAWQGRGHGYRFNADGDLVEVYQNGNESVHNCFVPDSVEVWEVVELSVIQSERRK